MHFRFPNIDALSFWLGIILASFGWWMYSFLRPTLQNMRAGLLTRQIEKKEKIHSSSSVEEHYRQSVLHHAQGLHLAAPLYSLDEIIVPPVLLAPPPRVEPGAPPSGEDIISAAVPYLPAWPELAAIYNAPTLTIAQALSGNSDIVLTGQPGIGKTVALAYLASRLARRDSEPGLPEDTIPFLVHIADLDLPIKRDDPLRPVIDLIVDRIPVLYIPRIPDFVRKAFSDGRALLLLDGTDELTPDGLVDAVEFIKAIKKGFSRTRVITTASSEYLDGLVTLNFIPFALAAWNSNQRLKFLERWGDLWANYVAVEAWAQTTEQFDSLLLNSWINAESSNLTPLELTLKTWGAYAGDILGSRPLDLIETHLRRLSPLDVPQEALETLALQVLLNSSPIFDPRLAREWIKTYEPPEIIAPADAIEETTSRKSEKTQPPPLSLIIKMVDSNLLTQHRNNRMRFTHPVFGGFLSGKALVSYKSDVLFDQPPCIGKFLALNFQAVLGDATSLVNKLLSILDRPLARNLLTTARWLRDATPSMAWSRLVLGRLVELLRQTGQPLGLRGQALCALIQSKDSSIAALFRQLLEEQDLDILQLAALGSGALRDSKAIEPLAALLSTQSPNVRRAACLALVSIGTTAAMDQVASGLLHGDENLRRAAAESLANHPGEGYAMLKEAAIMKEDLLVRRSSAYGLGRIPEPWAEELLNQMETGDDQWAVRNAATEVIENRQQLNPHIPVRLPPPTESPWIIAFAGKQGQGVSPDKPPTDLLLMALKSGTDEERLASLAYLRMMPVEGVFGALFQAMYGGMPSLRETAFQAVSEMAARGVNVPDPVQFGVGY
jgi:HEAT repeat protein